MLKTKTRAEVGAYSLVFLYIVLAFYCYARTPRLNLELLALIALMIAAAGLVFGQEWGRKLLIVSNIALAGYYLFLIVVQHRGNMLLGAFITASIAITAVYCDPAIACFYKKGFGQPNWQVLLVDDDPIFLRKIRRGLQSYGVDVMTMRPPADLLKKAGRVKPDLILIDAHLPQNKGKELCAQLKEDAGMRETPVAFMTEKENREENLSELDAGSISHISKNAGIPEIYSEINKILGI